MSDIKPGDLVWVPSEVTLYKFNGEGSLDGWLKMPQPSNLLVSEVYDNTVTVHYDGDTWEAKIRDIYPLVEKANEF